MRLRKMEGANKNRRITKKCTGVADRVEFEINVAGCNPVILVVRL